MITPEDPTDWRKWYTASIMGAFIFVIGTEKLPTEITCLLALLAVWIPGVINTADALSGFSNPGVCILGALFVVCHYLEKSRLIVMMMDRVLKARHVRWTLLQVSALCVFMSAFLNNVAVITLMMPFVRKWCCQQRIDRSKFYIPLAYCARVGGLLTTIGSSTNLIVIGLAAKSGVHIGMFELTRVSVILCVLVVIYIQVAYTFLPGGSGLFQFASETGFITQIEVTEELLSALQSPTVHSMTGMLNVKDEDMLYIFRSVNMPPNHSNLDLNNTWVMAQEELLAGTSTHGIPCRQDMCVEVGDLIMFVVQPHNVEILKKLPHVHLLGCNYSDMLDSSLVQVVVSDRNPLLGSSVCKEEFLRAFNATPVALRRDGQTTITSLSTWNLHVGDTLLLVLEKPYAEDLKTKHSSSFLVQLELDQDSKDTQIDVVDLQKSFHIERENPSVFRQIWSMRADWLPILSFAVYVVLVGLKISSATKGAFTLAVFLWLLLGQKRAIMSPVNGKVIFVAGCMNGFAQAITKSGFSTYAATLLVSSTSSTWGAYCLLNLGNVLLTEFIQNSACGAIVYPIALATATSLNVNPIPFILGVILSSSGGFMNPMGDNTLLLVFGPGGYKFREFVKVGFFCVLLFYATNCLVMKLIYNV